jgi:hypothetical protein
MMATTMKLVPLTWTGSSEMWKLLLIKGIASYV